MKELKKIKYWLFDLDNTLYSGDTKVFDQVDKKMSKFISEKLNVSIDEAKKIQKNYFHEYNTTLNGMIKNHDIDANEFLEFVHDVDLNFLNKDDFILPFNLIKTIYAKLPLDAPSINNFRNNLRKYPNSDTSEVISLMYPFSLREILHTFTYKRTLHVK